MVFGRMPRVELPGLHPGFKGPQRVLAAVVQAALRRARYDAQFLGPSDRSGLCIGTASDNGIVVGNIHAPRDFTWTGATMCAARLNGVLQEAVPGVGLLAAARQGTTSIGRVPYNEVVVRRPSDHSLRALYAKLVKQ